MCGQPAQVAPCPASHAAHVSCGVKRKKKKKKSSRNHISLHQLYIMTHTHVFELYKYLKCI